MQVQRADSRNVENTLRNDVGKVNGQKVVEVQRLQLRDALGLAKNFSMQHRNVRKRPPHFVDGWVERFAFRQH